MINWGTVPLGGVLPFPFATYAGATGASITLTGLALADILVYKGTSVIQRASTAGFVLIDTDGIDIDLITGIHGFTIDTGDNTDAGFYVAGSYYYVIISAVTVDAQVVNFVAGTFTLRATETVAGVIEADVTHFNGTAGTFAAGIPEVKVASLAASAITAASIAADAITDAKVAADVTIASVTGAVGSVTGAVGSVAAGGIAAASFAANAINAAALAADAVTEIRALASGTSDSGTTTTMVDAARTEADTDYWRGQILLFTSGTLLGQARIITAFNAATDTITYSPATTAAAGTQTYEILPGGDVILAQMTHTGVVLPNLDVAVSSRMATYTQPTGFLAATFPAGTVANTTNITAGTITTTTSLTNLPAITANWLTAAGIAADAITDAKVAADVTIASVTGAVGSVTGAVGSVTGAVGSVTGAVGSVTGAVGSIAAAGITNASYAADTGKATIRSNTAQAGAGTTITLDAGASAVTDFYVNALIITTGGTGVGQGRFITAYNGTTKVATVSTWKTNPDVTTTFAVVPFDAIVGATAPTAAQNATAVWTDLLAGTDFSTAASVGKLLKDNVDATISGRMATYTQPAGFLAATFPATVASSTNITAASGIAVSSIGAAVITAASIAVDAITDAKVAADVTIASVTGAVGSVTGAVGSVTGAVGSVTGAVGSVAAGGIANTSFAAGAIDAGAIAANAIGASELATDAVAEIVAGVWDELKSAHLVAGTYGQHFGAATESASVNDVGASTTVFVSTLASAVNSHYVGRVVIFTNGTLLNQATEITGYVGATKAVTVAALTSAPANGATFIIV